MLRKSLYIFCIILVTALAIFSFLGNTNTVQPTFASQTLLSQDTFVRSNQSHWGTASDGNVWGADASSNGVFSISSNTGLTTNPSSILSGTLGSTFTDGIASASGSISAFGGSDFGVIVRYTNANNWYKAYLDGTNLVVRKMVSGTNTVVMQTSFSASANTVYSVKVQILGDVLSAKAWTGSTEPDWMLSTVDTALSSAGNAGVQVSGAATTTFTSFTAYTLTQPTTTNNSQDTFVRSNQSHWGTASDANIWGADASSNSVFSISNNTGLATNPSSILSGTLGSTFTDGIASTSGSISAFGGSDFGVILRYTNTNNWYKAYIDGTNLVIRKMVSGANSVVGQTSFSASANTVYAIKFEVFGDMLLAKAWAGNSSEPDWMVSFIDTAQTGPGSAGIQVSGSATATFTSFHSYTISQPILTPTPTMSPTPTLTPTLTVTPTLTPTPGPTDPIDYDLASGIDPWGTAFDSSGNVWVAVPGCDPGPDCSGSPSPGKIEVFSPTTKTWIATYQLPAGYGQALFLAFDSSGNVWFPMFHTNELGMFNPNSQTFQKWTIPTANSGPWDIAIDQNQKIWITEHFINQIAKFDPSTHTFTEITTPAINSNPYGITVDASNNIWFTEDNDAVALVAKYTQAGQLSEYKIRNTPTSGTGLTPHLITTDSNGNVWWTEGFVGMLATLNVSQAQAGTNNGVTEYTYTRSCGGCGTHTSGISIDTAGLIWFTDSLQSIFGYFSPTTLQFTLYNTPTAFAHPHDGMHIDSQNNIWFTEEFVNKLAYMKAISALPTATPTPTTQSSSGSSSSNTSNSGGPSNVPQGYQHSIQLGPNALGNSTFISGSGGATAFIDKLALHDDSYIIISNPSLTEVNGAGIPFPWQQGFNTASNIYNFQIFSAFNGYPIPYFDHPVTIVLPLNPTITIGQRLSIARYNSTTKRWQILPNTIINWFNRTAATTTLQFGYFAVVYGNGATTYPRINTIKTPIKPKNNIIKTKNSPTPTKK